MGAGIDDHGDSRSSLQPLAWGRSPTKEAWAGGQLVARGGASCPFTCAGQDAGSGVWVSQPLPDSSVPLSLIVTPVLGPASLLCCPSRGCMPRAQSTPWRSQPLSWWAGGGALMPDAHTLLGLVAILLLTRLCSSLSRSLEMNFDRGM